MWKNIKLISKLSGFILNMMAKIVMMSALMNLVFNQNADEPELQMLVSNIDFDNISHDNTFALTKEDAKVLIDYLQKWIN